MAGSKSVLNFALIGCGRIAPKHVDALTSGVVPGAKLVAVCDTDFAKAEAIAKKHGVKAYADRFEMLEKMGSEIDVVSILTPSGLHAQHTIDVAKYQKHVVVEKPMSLTLQDADNMIAACDAAGVRLFVVKQNRY
ncbi:MAG: Gfo/Idh/MocA family protein, partial [Bdellovibrionales bacterium]